MAIDKTAILYKMPYKKTVSNFYDFLRNPKTLHKNEYSNSLKEFILLFIYSIVIDFFLGLLSTNHWIINKFRITNIDSHIEEIYLQGFCYSLVVIVVMPSLIEELLQRSYLTSFIWNNTLLPINVGLIFISVLQISGYYLLIFCIAVLVISNIIYSRLTSNKKNKIKYLKFYSKNYRFYFYLSAISFGAVHILNYEIENFIPGLTILLVLPQIFGGLILGYIRVSMGLRWCICFHALHNLFFLTFLFINHSHE